MTPDFHLLLFPELAQPPILSFQAALFIFLVTLLLAFYFTPGGLAWALTKSIIPGPVSALLGAFTGPTPHRALAKLARSHHAEKLMAFSIGLTRFVISSEPETAKEILGSTAFADRPVKESAYELLFHRAMGFAPYGEYWRSLRRISALHLFSPKRISSFEKFRRQVGVKMVEEVKRVMSVNGHVEVKRVLHFGSLNNVMMTVFGKCYEFFEGEGVELEGLVSEGYELLGVFNWSDHFPVLGWLDLQGVRRRCRSLVQKVNAFVGRIIEEHRIKRVNGEYVKDEGVGDFVDVLLDLENESKLSEPDMIAVLWEMIFRGTDTVAILLEWILARMVLHPEIQAKVQSEIDSVCGSKVVSDSDVANMRYLQCIVKEALRVHPPGPLLSWARLAVHDVTVGENHIPKGTTAMVNMWAITHDEKVWAEPEKFKPERFMEDDVSIMGSDLRLAPFGSGRRVCPGKALGLASVHLWLAQLLQSFRWVPSDGATVDLEECLKLSMEMKKPLACKAVPRVVV
ncbi:cytochrome P450 78A5 [Cajanus cajan]|uniref:Cytochrome P450 78A4 n=1 Tax=Cajanus cajan TaxID=3821 RepID=A0A151TFB3_CAJCA|nr:cytochrome P450 78A5 [Cajanus cajan]XP_029127395.1 cytochrome P450 78A5 [Cajanus cajan]KYP65717.1 Cytochrome P450 78A4 [Cajanus cajan]